MDIVVLLKQVPDTEALIRVAEDKKSIKTGDLKWVVNPYDEYAVEEAVRLREAHGGTVTILSAGGEKATEAIRAALAMGADKGVRVNDGGAALHDPLVLARILAAAIKTLPFDLIIAGQRAVDDDNYITGPAVAELLGIPQATMVVKAAVASGHITCHRAVEGGVLVTRTPLPMLFTAQKGLNEPRFASMMGIMAAKKKPIAVVNLSDIGISAEQAAQARMRVLGISPPPERSAGKIIEGSSASEKAASLAACLRQAALI